MKMIIFFSMIFLVTRATKSQPFVNDATAIYETKVESTKASERFNETTKGPLIVSIFTRERHKIINLLAFYKLFRTRISRRFVLQKHA